jgi:hypothetical protein
MNPIRHKHYATLWKMRTAFNKLNDAYAKNYIPAEHLAVYEVTVYFKGRVIFKQYTSKKQTILGKNLKYM